jgi:menaquinone-dependent protoporphyrinogen IX oxidase
MLIPLGQRHNVYSNNHTKHVNTFFGQSGEMLNIKPSAIHSLNFISFAKLQYVILSAVLSKKRYKHHNGILSSVTLLRALEVCKSL